MKKRVLYSIFCILCISALVVTLVILTKDKHNTSYEPSKSEGETRIYATSIFLLCPREINIKAGKQIVLDNDFLKVEPSNTTEKIEYEISSKSNTSIGINFENNKITATNLGFYYIKFYISSAEDKIIYDTLVIHVVEDCNQITQKIEYATIEDEISVYDIFEILPSFTISNLEVSNATLSNNKILFTTTGSVEICITLYLEKVSYNYKFNIYVNPKTEPPEYEIKILNYDSTDITLQYSKNKMYSIVYEVLNKEQEHVLQSVSVKISNTNVAEFVDLASNGSDFVVADEYFINFKCLSAGNFTLTIRYNADISITKILNISLIEGD